MESNRKRRGSIKSKLMPFYRVSKPSSTNSTTTTTNKQQSSMQYMMSNKVKPSSPSSVGFLVQNHKDYHVIATQAHAHAQPKQKITFIVPPSHADHHKSKQQQQQQNLAGDEMVDMKAATYISSVQERFKLEHINS